MADEQETVETEVENRETENLESQQTDNSTQTQTEETKSESNDSDDSPNIPYGKVKKIVWEREELRRQLEAEKAKNKPQQVAETQDPSPPNWDEYEAQGKTVEQFNEDYINYRVEAGVKNVLEKQQTKAKEDSEAQTMQERTFKADLNFRQSATKARASHNDFDAKMKAASEAGIDLGPNLNLILSESKNAGELAYKIASDHSLAYELMTLNEINPQGAILKLGEISALLQAGNSQPGKMTNSEPPVNPLSGGGAVQNSYDPKMSDAEFDRLFPPDF